MVKLAFRDNVKDPETAVRVTVTDEAEVIVAEPPAIVVPVPSVTFQLPPVTEIETVGLLPELPERVRVNIV